MLQSHKCVFVHYCVPNHISKDRQKMVHVCHAIEIYLAILTHIRMNFPSAYTWIKTREIYCHCRTQEYDQYNYTITISDIPTTKFENRMHMYNDVNIHKGWVVLWWFINACIYPAIQQLLTPAHTTTSQFMHLFNTNTLVPIQPISTQEPVCEYHIILKGRCVFFWWPLFWFRFAKCAVRYNS